MLALCDFLLDGSELFVKVAEFRAVLRLIIPTLHHDFRNLFWTVLWGRHPVSSFHLFPGLLVRHSRVRTDS